MIWQMMVALLHSNWQLRTGRDGDTDRGCQKLAVQQKLMKSNYGPVPYIFQDKWRFLSKKKTIFFTPFVFNTYVQGVYPWKFIMAYYEHFYPIPTLDRWTDGRTDIPYQYRVSVR